jgi:hypothetical protein
MDTLAHLFGDVELRRYNERQFLMKDLIPGRVVNSDFLQPDGGPRYHTPVNDRLGTILREPLREFVSADERWELEFDRFEYLSSIAYADLSSRDRPFRWAPVGSFGWRRRSWDDGALFAEIEEEAREAGDAWTFLHGPLFGGSLERFLEMKASVDQTVAQLPWL